MSQQLERVYTIPLGKVLLSPDNQRAKRAINMIKEFARKHMKTQEIRIDEDVNHIVWARGICRPPRKIRVLLTKTDEGYILVSTYEEEESEVKEVETKKSPSEGKDVETNESIPEVKEPQVKGDLPDAFEPKADKPKEAKPKAGKPKEAKPKADKPKEAKPKKKPE